MKVLHSDVLVIGGGLAGLRTAIGARRRGLDVTILSLVPPKRSHSAAAQGGMQASLANSVKGFGDNEDVHFADTVRGSDWGADQDVVRMFVHMAPKAVRELAHWGVPWNRVQRGPHQVIINGSPQTLKEADAAHGLITARNFGGTAKWRTCYVSDGTGHSMLYNVSDQAIAADIPVHERMEAVALIHDGGRCFGAVVRNLIDGELLAYTARATCIATGGFGRIYRVSTNAVINEGMGAAIALETGVATLGNMEAVQFHPTGIFPAGILVTEGCRGDGGLLLDGSGHRFMPDYEPEKAELASRDVVSRHMEHHIRQGHGAQSRFGEHLWLDIRLLGEDHINHKLREVKEICQYFLGIDPARELIPVRPAQHYSMGGIRTDAHGQSPTLRGLFACGEAACWDIHGFNRLGGNSVAETVVAGMIVGEAIADFCQSDAGDCQIDTALVREFHQRETAALRALFDGSGRERAADLLPAMQTTMTEEVGIYREGAGLARAVERLQELLARSANLGLQCRSQGANPELAMAYRLPRMLKLALCVAQGALNREESRGAHSRVDFPRRDDSRWLNRTLASWPAGAMAPSLSYEALDVMRMELPPGWRGYGAKDHLPHPDSARRQQQVDEAREQAPDRFALQRALLPFEHLLPLRYRGRNARFVPPSEAGG
jgi:fumarate reductase flavoprotein subunit